VAYGRRAPIPATSATGADNPRTRARARKADVVVALAENDRVMLRANARLRLLWVAAAPHDDEDVRS
jgi:hypothetical protein